jgi:tellurite resistance protein TehA-like permease
VYFVDFVLRFVAGSRASILGMLGNIAVVHMRPRFVGGPQKQFAALCGALCVGMAVAFQFASMKHVEFAWAAFAVLVMVSLLGFLECMVDFCLGCTIFRYLVQWGIVPDTVYSVYNHEKDSAIAGWDYANLPHRQPPPRHCTHHVAGTQASPVDAHFTTKSEEWHLDDWNVVKHVRLGFFLIPKTIGALALALKLGQESANLEIHQTTWHVVAVVSVAIYGVLAILMIAKILVFTNKFKAEVDCLGKGNFLALPLMTPLLYTLLMSVPDPAQPLVPGASVELFAGATELSRAAYWICGPLLLLVAVSRFAKAMSARLTVEHICPSWLVPPVGLLVATLSGVTIQRLDGDNDTAYGESALLYFSAAALATALLGPITLYAYLRQAHADDARRSTGWIFIAVFGVFSAAVDAITNSVMGTLSRMLYFASFFLLLSMVYSIFQGWMLRGAARYGAELWSFAFPVNVLAILTMHYRIYLTSVGSAGNFSKWLAWGALGVAAYLTVLVALWTLYDILRGKIFVGGPQMYTPLSAFKLTHEAIRGAHPRLTTMIKLVLGGQHPKNASNSVDAAIQTTTQLVGAKALAEQARFFVVVMQEHSRQEDLVMFKELDGILPGLHKPFATEHGFLDRALAKLALATVAFLDSAKGGDSTSAGGDLGKAQVMAKAFDEALSLTLPHLRHEEDTIQRLAKKHLPIGLARSIVRRAWDVTDANKWMAIMPWVVNNLPREEQRIRYLRAFMDVMPERCQQIGRFVYLGVAPATWAILRINIPEMIPRGAPGWKHLW